MCNSNSDTFISRSNDDSRAVGPGDTNANDDDDTPDETIPDIGHGLEKLQLIEYGPQLDPNIFDEPSTEITAWNLFKKYAADNLHSNIPRCVIWIRPRFNERGEHRLQVFRSIGDKGMWMTVKRNYVIVNDDGTGRRGPWGSRPCPVTRNAAASAVSTYNSDYFRYTDPILNLRCFIRGHIQRDNHEHLLDNEEVEEWAVT